MVTVMDYLEARVEALQSQLELQRQINEVEGKVPIDPVRAIYLIQHLNTKYGIPMTHLADRLGVTREWLRQNLKETKITKPMQNSVQSMVEDMISDLQLVLVEELT
jgi:hypothetical protein